MALAGPDGAKAAALLDAAQAEGVRIFNEVAQAAALRLLKHPAAAGSAKRFFTDAERHQIAEVLAATNAAADLLARVRIRERQQRVAGAKRVHKHADEQPFHAFAYGPVPLLPPDEALAYFRGLEPKLGVNPDTFGPLLRRKAFTLAAAADDVLLGKVQKAIADGLATGANAVPDVQGLLDAAGVSPKNPQYADMVVRTNAMDSYNTAAVDEMQHPDVRDTFPVWKYLGIADGRQRPSHDVHFNKYFPNSVSFAEIRDSVLGEYDGYNCRCTPSPVDAIEWDELHGKGMQVETTW